MVTSLQSYRNLRRNEPRLWRLETAPKKIYVAASVYNLRQAKRFARQLIGAKFQVVSSWLLANFSTRAKLEDWPRYARECERYGNSDLADLAAADTLIVLTDVPSSSGGLYCELGYFLGSGKTNVVVVGQRPNVFFFTDTVRWVPNSEGLVQWLCGQEHGR